MKRKMRLRIVSLVLLAVMCLILPEVQVLHGQVQREDEEKQFVEPDILYPEADGENGYYISCPEIRLVHKEKDAVMRYELELPDGEKKTGVLEGNEEQEEAEIVLEAAMKEGENILRVWMEECQKENPKEEDNQESENEQGKICFFKELIFRLDRTAPQKVDFSYQQTENGEILFSKEPMEVVLKGEDRGSGIAEIVYYIEGEKSGRIKGEQGSIVLHPGYRGKVKAYAVDYAGNRSEEAESKFIICENGLPEIQIEAEEEEKLWHSNPVTVKVQAWDSPGGSGIQSLKCYCNGQLIVMKQGEPDTFSESQMEAEFVVNESSSGGKGVAVVVEAMDWSGNSQTESRQVFYDNQAPEICVKGMPNGRITGKKIEADITLEEENLLAYCSVEVWRTSPDGTKECMDKKEEKAADSEAESRKMWKVHMEKDGIYEIIITARDFAGNKSEKTVTTTIDQTSPVIRYVDQMQGVYVPYFQWNYQINEMIQDFTEYTYEILLEGIPYITGTKYLTEGLKHLQVKAMDAAGNVSVAEAVFCIDHTSPDIQVADVADGEHYDQSVTMCVSVDGVGEWLQEIVVNGERINLSDGSQMFRHTFTESGEYCVRILAKDLAGNQSEKEVVFSIEKKKMTAETLLQPIKNVLTKKQNPQVQKEQKEEKADGSSVCGASALIVITGGILVVVLRRKRCKRA